MLTFKREYPTTGCHRCDGIRRLTGRPNALCLRHDPKISEEDRKRMGIPLESLKGMKNVDGE